VSIDQVDKLICAFREIMTHWCGLTVNPIESCEAEKLCFKKSPIYHLTLNFTGCCKGSCCMLNTVGLSRLLYGRLLGNEVPSSNYDLTEPLQELLNLSAGYLLPIIYGEENLLIFTPPAKSTTRDSLAELNRTDFKLFFNCEEEIIAFKFEVDSSNLDF
jgi:hypothetical protein